MNPKNYFKFLKIVIFQGRSLDRYKVGAFSSQPEKILPKFTFSKSIKLIIMFKNMLKQQMYNINLSKGAKTSSPN